MTDQVENKEDIFTPEPKKEVASDQEAKTVEHKAPDIDSIFRDKLSAIVDDKGEQKYRDPFTALEALKHSQEYIKTLEEENRIYREKKTQEDTLEEAFNRMSAKQEPEPTKSEGFDADKVKGMTFEAIQEYERRKQEDANKKAVSDALLQKFGDKEKAIEAYNKKAEELGIDTDTLIALSKKSPKAVLSYFNVEQKAQPNPSRGTVNTSAIKPDQSEDIDYTSRYFKSSSPETSKWRAAGESLK